MLHFATTLVLAFLFVSNLGLARVWIMGQNYVGYLDKKNEWHSIASVIPTSWGLDSSHCRVWLAEEAKSTLMYTAGGPLQKTGSAKKILSDVEKGIFLTQSYDRPEVQIHNQEGTITQTVQAPWVIYSERIVRNHDQSWSLNFDETSQKLWLSHLDPNLLETSTTLLSQHTTVWPTLRMVYESLNDILWLGWTAATTSKPYSPRIQRRSRQGELQSDKIFADKGVFFDMCANEDKSLLISRDIPSDSGFTVPVYSFLENIDASGKVQTVYSAEVNWLIRSIACQKDRVYMIQQSLFGSGGNRLVEFDLIYGKESVLTLLPGQAWKIYSCEYNPGQ
ncbi:MAG: hypothetical protein HY537_04785 [Deltaproteobacteria bacterium]|nr:hypothetical protein [Deltaproteobacteria bacterium]